MVYEYAFEVSSKQGGVFYLKTMKNAIYSTNDKFIMNFGGSIHIESSFYQYENGNQKSTISMKNPLVEQA